MNTIYLYNDEGTCKNSVRYTRTNFTAMGHNLQFNMIDAAGIIQGHWRHDATALILPGGADIPYGKKLNGLGNQQIIEYVASGGTFIGICAGAYYASRHIEFDAGGPLEVIGARPLKFFPGSSIGPILAPYNYDVPSGARIARLRSTDAQLAAQIYYCYYNGGGYFVNARHYANVKILYQYDDTSSNNSDSSNIQALAAIVECQVGKGQAILSGVHFEWLAEDIGQIPQACVANNDIRHYVPDASTLSNNPSNLTVLKDIISKFCCSTG